MAIDPDQPAVIREALAESGAVDLRTVQVEAAGEAVILRGAVATNEEASAAVAIAQRFADEVRNDLRVDVNLREDGQDGQGGHGTRDAPSVGATRDEAPQGTGDPVEPADDLVDDLQESLDENLPWDPPHDEVQVPTRAESRGARDRGGREDA